MDVDAWVEACVEVVRVVLVPLDCTQGKYECEEGRLLSGVLATRLGMIPSIGTMSGELDDPLDLAAYLNGDQASLLASALIQRGWEPWDFKPEAAIVCGVEPHAGPDDYWSATLGRLVEIPRLEMSATERELFHSLRDERHPEGWLDVLRAVAALAE